MSFFKKKKTNQQVPEQKPNDAVDALIKAMEEPEPVNRSVEPMRLLSFLEGHTLTHENYSEDPVIMELIETVKQGLPFEPLIQGAFLSPMGDRIDEIINKVSEPDSPAVTTQQKPKSKSSLELL